MLVVADSSPFIALINIGQIGVLPTLFGQVLIPPQVAGELSQPTRPAAVREFAGHLPQWLFVRAPVVVEPVGELHVGELAAIALAREVGADLLLIDDAAGRRAATDLRLAITGTVGVLELAGKQGLLDLAEAFARLKRTDFWISPRLLDERLALFLSRRPTH
jgi:predicted nucleic acid-binding protein